MIITPKAYYYVTCCLHNATFKMFLREIKILNMAVLLLKGLPICYKFHFNNTLGTLYMSLRL